MFNREKVRLTKDNLTEFRRKFGNFHDALVYEVRYKMVEIGGPREAVLTMRTSDWTAEEYVHIFVRLTISQVRSFILVNPSDSFRQIITQAGVAVFDDGVYIDFAAINNNPDDPENYDETPGNSSPFQIIGATCWVEILDDI